MGKDILHRVGNGGHCGCETVSREVLLQVEIPEKWTQEPPCFAITIWCAIKIAHQSASCHTFLTCEIASSIPLACYLHWGFVMHICVSELGHHWFRLWLVACLVPSHHFNQCWCFVNSMLTNKLQWKYDNFHSFEDLCSVSDIFYRFNILMCWTTE